MTNHLNDDQIRNSELDQIRESGLKENNALRVHRYLRANERARSRRLPRWIWELLQNALDASTAHDDPLTVKIEYRPEELIFLHNGSSFKGKQIFNLIYHGSTKADEEEAIGEYGSGFLTTHLLSPEIKVSGQFNNKQWFDFRLTRKSDSPKALLELMDEAWENFKESLSTPEQSIPDSFTTRFIYPIIGSEAEEAVEKGIEMLEQCAPYVVVFNPKFSGIDINNHGEMLCFQVPERTPLNISTPQQISVTESKNEELRDRKYLLTQGEFIHDEKKISVATAVELNSDGSVCQSVKKIPRLFKAVPLVGTESFSFPAVINSLGFEPSEDRDDVYIGQGNDEANIKNQAVIEKSCALLIYLLQHAASEGWHHAYQWAEVPVIQHPTVETREWLKTCIRDKFIEEISQTSVISTETNKPPIAPKDAWLPLAEDDKGIKELRGLLNDLQEYCDKLPRRDEAIGWCEVIRSWASVNGCTVPDLPGVSVIDGQQLASYIRDKCSNLKDLQNLLQENVCAVDWLNQFYGFLKDNRLFDGKIRDLYIFPNQAGEFNPLDNLYRDNEVDKGLKEVDNLLGGTIQDQLLDTQLESLENEMGARNLNNEDVIGELIDNLQARVDDNSDRDFKKASTLLFAWIVNSNQKDYSDLLLDVPVFTKDGEFHHSLRNTVHNGETLLAPVCSWPKDLQECKNIFPPNRVLADDFFKEVNDSKVWGHLDKEGVIRIHMIIEDEKIVNSQDFLLVGELGEDESHESGEVVFVTNIVERVEIMRRVKGNSNYAPPFWQLLTEDVQGLVVRKATCTSCETPHEFEYYPAEWLMRVREDKWIRGKDRRYAIPNASSLAQMLRDNKLEIKFLTENPVSNKLMEIIGVEQPDLRLEFIAEEKEKRNEVINLATTLYDSPQLVQHMQDNENLPQDIEQILEATGGDLSQVVEDIGERKEQQDRMDENRDFGKQVENWVKQILEQNLSPKGFSVTPKHTGSDLEILPETFDISTQEIIRNGKTWLVEVKGTRVQNVKLSFEQTKNALDESQEFLLCVVPIPEDTEPKFETVRENMRFIKNIRKKLGNRVATLCSSIDRQKDVEDCTFDDTSPGIVLDFERGKAGIRVQKSIWKDEGFPLEDLVEHLK